MIINYVNLPEKKFLSQYFKILNTAQPSKSKRLTASESDVLVEFMMLPSKFENKRFGTLAKSKVIETLGKEGYKLTRANLNNKIYSLLDKGYLWKDTDSVIYPKEYILHGTKEISESVTNGKNFDITFRFKNDSTRSQGDIPTNISSNGNTNL